jgi:hypothetical protein
MGTASGRWCLERCRACARVWVEHHGRPQVWLTRSARIGTPRDTEPPRRACAPPHPPTAVRLYTGNTCVEPKGHRFAIVHGDGAPDRDPT